MYVCVHVHIGIAMHTHIGIQAKKRGLYRIDLFVTSSHKSPKKRGLGEFRNCHNMLGLVGCFGFGFVFFLQGVVIQCFTLVFLEGNSVC